MARRESLSARYNKLLDVMRDMAREYDALCETMMDHYGCEGCPLNVESMDGGGCTWYGKLQKQLNELGVLDDD